MAEPQTMKALEASSLSELLTLAIEDVRAAITAGFDHQGRHYKVAMNMYTYVNKRCGSCEVCLAGAVMLRDCPEVLDWDLTFSWVDVPKDLEARLDALNCLRTGDLWGAYSYSSYDKPSPSRDQFRDFEYLFTAMGCELEAGSFGLAESAIAWLKARDL